MAKITGCLLPGGLALLRKKVKGRKLFMRCLTPLLEMVPELIEAISSA
jgi:hypothetical protein